jgi:hypothetical protein
VVTRTDVLLSPLNLELHLNNVFKKIDRLCGLVVRVLVYRSAGPGSIPGTTSKKKN